MKHLGDITKIDGAAVEPVEVIIGGSPCQDLSVAGKREGLSGERSGLFMEQIRIIKEMREHDRQNGATYIRPRYMVWENVPGAFSSNKGEDFRIVLEETARVVEPTAVIPRPEKGKWTNAGAIVGDGWSIAWRVFDAQFWGVPQRRRRIALVADFGGATAPEILFERKGVFGDITQSATPWKDFAVAIAKRFGKSDRFADNVQHVVYDARGNGEGGTVPTITGDHENRVTDYTAIVAGFASRAGAKSGSVAYKEQISPTLFASRHDASIVMRAVGFPLGFRPENVRTYNETATTLCNGTRPGNCNGVIVRSIGNGQANSLKPSEKAETLNCMHDQQAIIVSEQPIGALCARDYKGVGSQYVDEGKLVIQKSSAVCYGICSYDSNAMKSNNPNSGIYEAETTRTLDGNGGNPSCNQGGVAVCQSTVRRLTPLECERLQGFPDNFTNIGDYTDTNGKKRKTSDSARYKALGNSIALPSWAWLLERLNRYCRYHTMASLFDGIGGFPLIWETLNGKGSCVWASEIEEFPIAVTKYHFGEEQYT